MATETEWFEEWFDSPLYEKLYAHRDEKEAEVLADLIASKLSPENYNPLLDLGCGRGRHSIKLAQRGFEVTGVDLSPRAISQARNKAEKLGIDSIQFTEGDMREPLDLTFNTIVNLFTTFGYFEQDSQNRAVLDSVSTMLNPDGIFVLDFLNAYAVKKSIIPRDEGSIDGKTFTISREIKKDMVHKTITFTNGHNESKKFEEQVKLYDKNWFEEELAKRNFSIKHMYGSYDGEQFNPENSPRLIIFAQKNTQS